MRAVVLVGGFGTRLRPLTLTTPKPMLPVGHVPIIERLVDNLSKGGVTEVTLALGFKPEPFVEAFPGGECNGVALRYAVEPEPLDTAGAIRFAADFSGIDDTFVVANGDVLTDLDIASLVAFHRSRSAEATIHLISVEDPSSFGVVATDERGRVERFVEKPAPGTAPSNQINGGTYVLEPSVLRRIPAGRKVSIERATFPDVVDDGRLYAMATDDYWIDAGNPVLYLQANLDLLDGTRRHHACVGVHPAADVDRHGDGDGQHRRCRGRGRRRGHGHRLRSVAGCRRRGAGDGGKLRGDGQDRRGCQRHRQRARPARARCCRRARVGRTPPSCRLDVNVLVVGGAGFLGSHLVDRLIAEDNTVDVVDDLSSGSLANLADARAAGGALKIHTLDVLADEFAALVAMRPPDVVYHLSWLAPGRGAAAQAGRAVQSTLAVLEAARLQGSKVVTALPGAALYGEVPLRDLPIKEGHTWNPVGLHGIIAKAVVDILNVYRADHTVEFTALAMSTVYGPRQRPDGGVVATFAHALRTGASPLIHGDGRQTRDFLYVDDAVDALRACVLPAVAGWWSTSVQG